MRGRQNAFDCWFVSLVFTLSSIPLESCGRAGFGSRIFTFARQIAFPGEELFGVFSGVSGELLLEGIWVETGGKEPTARQLSALIARAKNQNVKLILVQRQFATAGARAVAEAIGGAVVAVDPLAEDYLENLRRIAAAIAESLEPSQQPSSSQVVGSAGGQMQVFREDWAS